MVSDSQTGMIQLLQTWQDYCIIQPALLFVVIDYYNLRGSA